MNEEKIDSTVPNGWAIEELGDVLIVQGGSQPPKSEFKYEPSDGYIRLLQIRDFGDKPVPTFVPVDRVTKFCKKEDVLIARYGASLGRIVTGMEGAYNVALAKVITSPELFNNRYLFYLLQTSIFQTSLRMISRSAQNGFAKHEIARVKLPIPPFKEQLRIVEKIEELFSELDAGISSLKKAQAQLKTYRQALLKHAFEGKLTADWRAANADKLEPADVLLERIKAEREARQAEAMLSWQTEVDVWETAGKPGKKPRKPRPMKVLPPLTEEETAGSPELPAGWAYLKLGEIIDDPNYGTSKKCTYENEGVGVLRIPNIALGKIDPEDLKYANFDDEEISKYALQTGDILIIRSNGSISIVGKSALVEPRHEHFLYAGYLIRLRPISKIVRASFIQQLLSSHALRNQIERKAKSTSGVNNINSGEIQSLIIPITTLDEQTEIKEILSSKLSVLDAIEQTINENLKKSEALRQSILKQAFSGQLVSQNPNDEPASVLLERIKAEKVAA